MSSQRKGRKPTPEEKARWEKIRKDIASGKIKIAFPERTYINSFKAEVREILDAFGVNAFVSDQSTMGDFDLIDDFEGRMEKIRALGIEAEPKDYVFELGRRLHRKRLSDAQGGLS